jgi:quercetin dioxygenase-like cupin family protein
MRLLRTWTSLALAILCPAIPVCDTVAAQSSSDISQHSTAEPTRIAFSHALPRLDGGHLNATIVEVTYGPGESSPPHSHSCAVIGYVIKGALRTRVKGQAEAIYRAGAGFYEAPNGTHMISANASDKMPVKFLAYFVCDHDVPLSVAPLESSAPGGGKP